MLCCFVFCLDVWALCTVKKIFCHFAVCFYLDTRQNSGALPSVFTLALGKHWDFAECFHPDTRQNPPAQQQISTTLPSARVPALGKACDFAECQGPGTRQSVNLCRVPYRLALGKVDVNGRAPSRLLYFTVCLLGTRQTCLPSARETTLGKANFAE
jgi:hypothetical protein